MNAILGFSGFVCSLSIYLLVARKAGGFPNIRPDAFFLSSSNHNDSQFASSQISYALQMATVYPFFIFAFTGLWWLALWNTLFYAIGIVLLTISIKRFSRGRYHLVGTSTTLHAFISNLHDSPQLRQFTAWMSLIGFTGLAAFEIVWGARVLRVLFNNQSVYYITILVLGFYLVLYLCLGGQRGTLNTAQYQLVIAYLGIHGAVAWIVLQPKVSQSSIDAPILVPLVLAFSLVMLLWRIWPLHFKQLNSLGKVASNHHRNLFTNHGRSDDVDEGSLF